MRMYTSLIFYLRIARKERENVVNVRIFLSYPVTETAFHIWAIKSIDVSIFKSRPLFILDVSFHLEVAYIVMLSK